MQGITRPQALAMLGILALRNCSHELIEREGSKDWFIAAGEYAELCQAGY